MPKIIKELSVQAPLATVWELVSDMERFSTCVPGCKEVRRLSETEYDWVLEARVLRTTRKVTARTRSTEMQAPRRAVFVGEGRIFEQSNHYRLTLQGATDLDELPGGLTRVRFEAQVNASGPGGALIEKIAAAQMDDLFADFEKNVQQALVATGAPSSLVPAPESEAGVAPGTQEDMAEVPPQADGSTRGMLWIAGLVAASAVTALLFWVTR